MSRLMPINNLPTFLDGILPTPKIREIKISYTDFPPVVSNPHIDHQRETITYENRHGGRSFKHPGFTLKKDPRNLLLEVTVVLVDNITSSGQSKWVLQQDLLKYMHLQVIHSENKEFSDKLKKREIDPIISEINRRMPNDGSVKTQVRSLSDIEALEGFYKDKIPEPGLKELVLKFNFAVNTTSPEHLSYFTNVYLDVDQLINDYSLNLNDEMIFSSCGDTTVESVYRNGVRVDAAKAYYYKDSNAPYVGNVYKVAPNTYVSAKTLNDNMIRREMLSIVTVSGQPQVNSTAGKYIRQLLKVIQQDDPEQTKLHQITKMVGSWKSRNSSTVSGSIYKRVREALDRYRRKIDNTGKITSKHVPNRTINDTRDIERSTEIAPVLPDSSDVRKKINDIRSEGYNSTTDMAAKNLENAQYFSRCMFTRDRTAAVRLTFMIDWGKLAVESSAHRKLIEKASPEIRRSLLSKISIKNVRLIRERQDEKDTLSQFDNHMTRDREAVVEVIADASLDPNTGKLHGKRTTQSRTSSEQKHVGSMQEISISQVTSAGIRAFEAHDRSIVGRKAGLYRYRAEVSFIDQIGTMLYDKVKELRTAKEELKKYYNLCILPCNYDTLGERFTEFFLSALYKTYQLPNYDFIREMSNEDMNLMLQGKSPLAAPWLRPVAKYVELVKIINAIPDNEAQSLAMQLYSQLEPSSASPDSILYTINRFDLLEKNILDAILVKNLGNETSGYSFGGSKISNKLTKAHYISYQFSDIYSNKTLTSVGAKYLSYGSETPAGLTRITKVDFLRRIKDENKRFFTNTPMKSDEPTEDMATYRFSYLAPAHLRVGGKQLQLLNRGEALYTTEQYKEMMLSISLLKTNPAARSMTMPILDRGISSMDQSANTDIETSKINMAAITMLANYGISIAPETQYLKKRATPSTPLTEVTSVLGENTLLAIHNAIRTDPTGQGSLSTSQEVVTDFSNANISIADITPFATSLVSTLIGTGLQNFTGISSDVKQLENLSEEKTQQIALSRTLEFFDMSNPYNGLDAGASNIKVSDRADKLRKIPNQVKSLLLTKTGKVSPRKNWHQSEIDPVASPDTRPLFELLYFNLQKIEVLMGFQGSSQGKKLLRNPKFELLGSKHLDSSGKLLCRMSKYRNEDLQIGMTDVLELPVYNRYFVLDLDSQATTNPNPVVSADLYTAGSEYQNLDGTNYIGYYHIHKDGTVMTGGTMSATESKLLPYNNTTTQSDSAAAVIVDNLSPSPVGGYERIVLTSLMSKVYAEKDVVSDNCVTEETISASGVATTINPGGTF